MKKTSGISDINAVINDLICPAVQVPVTIILTAGGKKNVDAVRAQLEKAGCILNGEAGKSGVLKGEISASQFERLERIDGVQKVKKTESQEVRHPGRRTSGTKRPTQTTTAQQDNESASAPKSQRVSEETVRQLTNIAEELATSVAKSLRSAVQEASNAVRQASTTLGEEMKRGQTKQDETAKEVTSELEKAVVDVAHSLTGTATTLVDHLEGVVRQGTEAARRAADVVTREAAGQVQNATRDLEANVETVSKTVTRVANTLATNLAELVKKKNEK